MVENDLAYREIRRLFYAAWVSKMTVLNLTRRDSVIAYVPEVKWEERQLVNLMDYGVHYCHFLLRNVITSQKSLTGGRVEEIGTLYTTRGIAIVDLYFSKNAYKINDKDAIENATWRIFVKQTTPGGVWFRNPTISQLPPEETYFRSMVTSDFTFDTEIE